jgi:short-subunit dehydrogenase
MNILITGATKGIGYELALEFAKCENANLCLIARTKEKLDQIKEECLKINPASEITVLPFDIQDLVDDSFPMKINFEHIDIVINNAGLLIKKEFTEFTAEDLMNLVKVNFIAPSLLIKYCIPKMGGKRPSHVVNIGSMSGFQGSVKFDGLSIYSATKAALISLTECLAGEFASKNIFFNCLALGAVQTEMLNMAFPHYKALLGPKEIASYICQFAKEGYKYYNGKVLPVSLSTP